MTFQADMIERLCHTALVSLGMQPEDAKVVSHHMVEADLRGVRSHGVLRLTKYIEQIKSGYININGAIETDELGPCLLRVSANQNFGILAFSHLVPQLVSLARQQGVAAGAVIDCAHTARIGAYTEAAAQSFAFAQVFGGGAHERLREVAPFGGAEGVYDTNPYAFSMPTGRDHVASADFATSATAQGKMLVHRTNGSPVPEGWIVDRDGNPSTDAEDFYNGGAMLPSAGSKGGGMAVIAELFGRAALDRPHELNWVMVVIDLQRFVSHDDYDAASNELLDKIEKCRPQRGFEAVMWPGQPEARRKAQQMSRGTEYTADEIDVIIELADRFDVK